MAQEIEAQVLQHHSFCITLSELVRRSGFTDSELHELVELGALDVREDAGGWLFPTHALESARTGHRLRDDFDLSLPGVALLLAYRERVHELEQRLRDLECQLPHAP